MRRFTLGALFCVAMALPAAAQDAPPKLAGAPPPASPYPPSAAATTPTQPVTKPVVEPDERLAAKYVRQTCHDYAESQNFKNEAMQQAVSECVAKIRPDLAGTK